jgi:hypothetical protein
MYVSTMDVDDAVLRMFSNLCVPAGRKLSYSILVKEWPRTHLRHADLAESVQRLVRLQFVQAEHSAGGHWVTLTQSGFDRAEKLAATRVPSWTWRMRMTVLQGLRSLSTGDSWPGRRRRLRDRVQPQL